MKYWKTKIETLDEFLESERFTTAMEKKKDTEKVVLDIDRGIEKWKLRREERKREQWVKRMAAGLSLECGQIFDNENELKSHLCDG